MNILMQHVDDKEILHSMLGILSLTSREFVPALHLRNSAQQTELKLLEEKGSSQGFVDETPFGYFETIKDQSVVVNISGDAIVGFLTYSENTAKIDGVMVYRPNLYINTVVVHPDFRGNGAARQMYARLFEEYKKHHVYLRTWSTNVRQLSVLNSLGFRVCKRIENDRGEGIDTLYMWRMPLWEAT